MSAAALAADERVKALLLYLQERGGATVHTDDRLAEWADDRDDLTPDDTIDAAFRAGFAETRWEGDTQQLAITPAGVEVVAPDPFFIHGPAHIAFSGGRTSGYLLWRVLQAHGGRLPPDVHVLFANTGDEHPATLDFVQGCSARWGVPIVWLEYDPEAEYRTRIVGHNSASLNGEPFDAIIDARQMLPNPVACFCTVELKIRRQAAFMRHIMGYSAWTSVVGLRKDEDKRVQTQLRRHASGKDGRGLGTPVMPLHAAGVENDDVLQFWGPSEFDLALPVDERGRTKWANCKSCHKLAWATRLARTIEDPEGAQRMADREARATAFARTPGGAVFTNKTPPYAELLRQADQRRRSVEPAQPDPFDDGESVDCSCTA